MEAHRGLHPVHKVYCVYTNMSPRSLVDLCVAIGSYTANIEYYLTNFIQMPKISNS